MYFHKYNLFVVKLQILLILKIFNKQEMLHSLEIYTKECLTKSLWYSVQIKVISFKCIFMAGTA